MVSLYKRATPSQAAILRIVEGAIRNTQHAHPELEISPQHRRSISKRAAGTLTAQMPEVLAASKPSESGGVKPVSSRRCRSYQVAITTEWEASQQIRRRFPLRQLIKFLSQDLSAMKRTDPARAAAFVEVLRMIDGLKGD